MPATIDMRYGCNPHQAAARCFMADGRDLAHRAAQRRP